MNEELLKKYGSRTVSATGEICVLIWVGDIEILYNGTQLFAAETRNGVTAERFDAARVEVGLDFFMITEEENAKNPELLIESLKELVEHIRQDTKQIELPEGPVCSPHAVNTVDTGNALSFMFESWQSRPVYFKQNK